MGKKGAPLSEEHRKKLSEAMRLVRQKKAWGKGVPSWNKGVSPSEQTREKISQSLRGRPMLEVTRAALLKANLGNAYTKGRPISPEHREKLKGRTAWNKGKPILPQAKKALLAANWKGGRIAHGGYVRVRCEGHPRASPHGHYVLEHILVVEKHFGRYLEKQEVVHHLNGIKNDNRIENLAVLTPAEHLIHHKPWFHRKALLP